MAIATDRETWVGRSLERVEDEALLRGEGRFMDDLEPVPHAWHAAIVRSQLAHAHVTVDPSAALELPGVRGVLTGDDVARLSKPFAAGIDSPVPQYAAAVGTARYVGEPLAVVVARDRYLAEDAAELVAVDYDPLAAVVDVTAAEPIHERSFHYGDVDDALARAEVVVRTTFRMPRSTGLPVECYGVVCDWDESAGRLTAWANFQGPFTLARCRGRGARPPRRSAPAAYPAGLGRLVRDQGGRAAVRRARRTRLAGARRPGALD